MTFDRITHGLILLLAAGAAGAAEPGSPQYREHPTVLPTVRPAPAADTRLDRLSRAVAGASPRVALFWDRDVSEETHSTYRSITSRRETSSHDGYATRESTYGRGGAPDTETYEGEGRRHKDTETVRTEERVRELAAPMDQTEIFVETRIKEHLAAAGVKFVSAAMATRLAAMQDSSERPDRNKAEMKGLTKDADYLMKVEPTFAAAKGAPTTYRVTLTSLRDSQQVVDFVTDAKPQAPAAKKKFVATARGYEPAPATESTEQTKVVATARGYELVPVSAEQTLEDHARELALQIADRMATALGGR